MMQTNTTSATEIQNNAFQSLTSETLENADLPNGWVKKPFAEVADYQTGRTPARANPRYWNADELAYPWVSIRDMQPYGLITNTSEKISKSALDESFRGRISKAGTLLMSFKLTIGRVATLGVDACHNEAIISIYPKTGVNQKYLEYFLSQVDYTEYQDRAVKGHTLNQEKIDRIEILLPPNPEQEKIAAVLWKVQRAIEIQDRLIAATRDLKVSAMQQLFTHGLRGLPARETEIGLIPETWKIVPLGEAYETQLGKMLSQKAHGGDSPKPYLRNKNVQWGYIDLSDLLKMDFNERELVKFRLRPGDLLVCEGGIIGRAAMWHGEIDECYFQKALHRIRPRDKSVTNEFLCYWLSFAFEHQNLYNIGGASSTIAHIPQALLEGLQIPLPESNEQIEIATALSNIDGKLKNHQKKRAALNDLFHTLLHKLMTAEIRVQELDIDVSEVFV